MVHRTGRVNLKPTYQQFAERVAAGGVPTVVYGEVFGTSAGEACRKGATRMSKNVPVQEEILRIRREAEKLAGGSVLTVLEKREYLALVLRTPLSKVDPSSVLCQEMTIVEAEEMDTPALPGMEQEMRVFTTKKIKMVDKLRAIEIDSKLAGDFAEDKNGAVLAGGLADAVAEIRKSRVS